MARSLILLCCAALAIFAVLPQAGAATYAWGAAVTGDFTEASKWVPSGVPGSSDTAILSLAGTINVSSTQLVNSFSMSAGTFNITAAGSASLTTALDFSISGVDGNSLLETNHAGTTLFVGRDFTTGTGTNTTEFVFPANSLGIGDISVGRNLNLSSPNDVLTIDATAYAGSGTSFILFQYSGTLTGTFNTVHEIGFTGDIVYDTVNKQVRVDNFAVPEPSSFALLIVAGALLWATHLWRVKFRS